MKIIRPNQIPGWPALLTLFLNLAVAAFLLQASISAHGYGDKGQLSEVQRPDQSLYTVG